MEEKIKEYIVKIPIYTSENITNENTLFGTTYDNMLIKAKEVINKYNSDANWQVTSENRAKTSVTGVNKIEVIDCKIGRDACLLLKTTVFKTKLIDGYYESEKSEVIFFKENDKICSNTHFVLLYPNIFNNVVYWRVFVYEDPTKTNDEVTKVAKLIMKDILSTPIRNIKEEKLLAEIKSQGIINGMEISLVSLNDNDDETPPYLHKYLVKTKVKQEKKIRLENVPSEECIKAFENIDFPKNYSKLQIRYLLNNKRVLMVTQELAENLKKAFEDSFNYSFTITESELKSSKIFDHDYIINRMSDVVNNFMSVNGN